MNGINTQNFSENLLKNSEKFSLRKWYNGTFPLVFLGVLCYTLALPRFNLTFLAWFASFFWTPIILREKLTGKRPFLKIYLAGVIFWAIAVHWVCFPYWATCFGWVAMSFYLACYIFLFFVMARGLVHRLRIPVVLAMPIAWVSSEWLQRQMLGGFSFGAIEHTQVHHVLLIQIADLFGEYTVGALIIFVGSTLGTNLPVNLENLQKENQQKRFFPKRLFATLGVCFFVILIVICYGFYRTRSVLAPVLRKGEPGYQVALLQGTDRAILNAPLDWYEKVYDNYIALAKEAVKARPDLDLMIWPESTSIYPWGEFGDSGKPEETSPGQQSEDERKYDKDDERKYYDQARQIVRQVTRYFDTAMIHGIPGYVEGADGKRNTYNSALLMDRHGTPLARYDKMQLVIFGEYVPFADWLPDDFFLKTLCQRSSWGKAPVNVPLPDRSGTPKLNASANICFESSIPQLIRNQVLQLRREGTEPDVLINISNDGWFRHSSQIDMHLATHIFRAIENRKPYLSATNGGFSVSIDGNGRILECGKRNIPSVVFADVYPDGRVPPYHFWGDWWIFACFLLSLPGLASWKFVLWKSEKTASLEAVSKN